MYIQDTIAAISTPHGEGGIGIIRVSGSQAKPIGMRVFRFCKGTEFTCHFLHYGNVIDPDSGAVLDEAMAVLMLAPYSYTREDVLEIHCHGGLLIVERVLSVVLLCGARLAESGEFTRRAFINGRIDLVEAEAVMDVISSRSEASMVMARKQQEGSLSRCIGDVRSLLMHSLALVEAYIDFPEDDLGDTDVAAIRNGVITADDTITSLINNFDEGRILRDGIAVLIVGKPNVGKSSLLNRLLGEQRAIVTHIAGTTRDIIEETTSINGLAVRLLDTAGIRHTDDVVEQEGIGRALECIPLADLALLVLDSSGVIDVEDERILLALRDKTVIVVCNKCDVGSLELPHSMSSLPQISVSASSGAGIDDLKSLIRNTFVREGVLDSREFVAITKARHKDALLMAHASIGKFIEGIAVSRELETLAIDLRDSLAAIGQITGETTTDDILDMIFSSFCIGK